MRVVGGPPSGDREAGRARRAALHPQRSLLHPDSEFIAVITGPNMGGKSTYLRQAALLAILAQMGSFVPAESALLPIVDRVFTRIGAADNLARGRSTFMVEMTETAVILNTATARSLIVLDEIGRGTSTYDGLALAWAVVEHIHQHIARQDAVRDALSRADRARRAAAGRPQSACVGERSRAIRFCSCGASSLEPPTAAMASRSRALAALPMSVIERARADSGASRIAEHTVTEELAPRPAPHADPVVRCPSITSCRPHPRSVTGRTSPDRGTAVAS